MAYIATSQSGLGTWWNPTTWGTPDPAQARQTAGDVRYCMQLDLWTRQTRLWFNGKMNLARQAGNTEAMQAIAKALGDLVKVEDHIDPYMRQIADAQRQVIADGNDAPANWDSIRWQGWQGTGTQPPAAPPPARALTESESRAGGLAGTASSPSYFLYLLAMLLLGAVFIVPAGIAGTITGIVLIGASVAAAVAGSAAGQDAVRAVVEPIARAAGSMLPLLAIAGAAVIFILSGQKRKRTAGTR